MSNYTVATRPRAASRTPEARPMQRSGPFGGHFKRVAEKAAASSGRTVFAVIRDGAFTITDTPRDDEQRLGTCEPGGTYTRAEATPNEPPCGGDRKCKTHSRGADTFGDRECAH